VTAFLDVDTRAPERATRIDDRSDDRDGVGWDGVASGHSGEMDRRGSRATVRLEGAAVVDTAREALAHNRSDESECECGTDGGTAAGGSEVGPPARSPLCRRSFSAPSDRLAPPPAALAFPVSAIGAQSAPIVPRLPRLRISLARNTAHGRAAYLLLFHAGLHEAEGREGEEKAKRMRAAVSRSGAGILFVRRRPRVTLAFSARARQNYEETHGALSELSEAAVSRVRTSGDDITFLLTLRANRESEIRFR